MPNACPGRRERGDRPLRAGSLGPGAQPRSLPRRHRMYVVISRGLFIAEERQNRDCMPAGFFRAKKAEKRRHPAAIFSSFPPVLLIGLI